MRDLRQANAVLGMAHKDFKALQGMMDPEVFHEEIFGVHAQQAIEKSLKAWLALLGWEYPLTHDISWAQKSPRILQTILICDLRTLYGEMYSVRSRV